jgi:hypothetical protein
MARAGATAIPGINNGAGGRLSSLGTGRADGQQAGTAAMGQFKTQNQKVEAGGSFSSQGASLFDGEGGIFRDPEVGRLATDEANEALSDSFNVTYRTLNNASIAWSDAVRPVADKYNTEIGSKLFSVKGGYRFGRAHSDGVICGSRGCSVNTNIAQDIRGGIRVGSIHTHPGTDSFSGNDLYNAHDYWRRSGVHQTNYVTLHGGGIRSWSTEDYVREAHKYPQDWNAYRAFERVIR